MLGEAGARRGRGGRVDVLCAAASDELARLLIATASLPIFLFPNTSELPIRKRRPGFSAPSSGSQIPMAFFPRHHLLLRKTKPYVSGRRAHLSFSPFSPRARKSSRCGGTR
jgi:hypothetical protein